MNKYFEKTDRTYNYDIFRMEPMPETPFKFREDDSFQSLVESIDKYGLLTPITDFFEEEWFKEKYVVKVQFK